MIEKKEIIEISVCKNTLEKLTYLRLITNQSNDEIIEKANDHFTDQLKAYKLLFNNYWEI